MSVSVGAGQLIAGASANEVSVYTKLNNGFAIKTPFDDWLICSNLTPISVNGHSISAINPELFVRGEATPVLV